MISTFQNIGRILGGRIEQFLDVFWKGRKLCSTMRTIGSVIQRAESIKVRWTRQEYTMYQLRIHSVGGAAVGFPILLFKFLLGNGTVARFELSVDVFEFCFRRHVRMFSKFCLCDIIAPYNEQTECLSFRVVSIDVEVVMGLVLD